MRADVASAAADRLLARDVDPALLSGHVAAYTALTDAARYDEAWALFRDRLDAPTRTGLRASRLRGPLLERLFGAGAAAPPTLTDPRAQADVCAELAQITNLVGGRPGAALTSYRLLVGLCEERGDDARLSATLGHFAKSLRQAGHFRESEDVARRGLAVQRARGDRLREAVNLYWLGMGLAHRGVAEESEAALQRALRIFEEQTAAQASGATHAFLAQRALWLGHPGDAVPHADAAWALGLQVAGTDDLFGAVKVLAAAARMQGEALVLAGDLTAASDRLAVALTLAGLIDFVEETLPALRALALLELARDDLTAARGHLHAAAPLAARGPYPLYASEAALLLASVELRSGNRTAAVAAARTAHDLAWCDGPPFAYDKGLREAAAFLDRPAVRQIAN